MVRMLQMSNQQMAQFGRNRTSGTRQSAVCRRSAIPIPVELSNQYGPAWAGGGNQYVLSELEGFNPNVTVEGTWKRMEAVKP